MRGIFNAFWHQGGHDRVYISNEHYHLSLWKLILLFRVVNPPLIMSHISLCFDFWTHSFISFWMPIYLPSLNQCPLCHFGGEGKLHRFFGNGLLATSKLLNKLCSLWLPFTQHAFQGNIHVFNFRLNRRAVLSYESRIYLYLHLF